MDILWIIGLIFLIFLGVKELKNDKKLPNDNAYNLLQNSRHYRLLFVVIAGSVCVIIVIVKKIFF